MKGRIHLLQLLGLMCLFQAVTAANTLTRKLHSTSSVPGRPYILNIEGHRRHGLTILVQPPFDDGGAEILRYRVVGKAADGSPDVELIANPMEVYGVLTFRIRPGRYTPSVEYTFRVWAQGEAGYSAPSAPRTKMAPPASVADAPTLVRRTTSDPVVWTVDPPENTGGLPITGYEVVGVVAKGGQQVVALGGSNDLGDPTLASEYGERSFQWAGQSALTSLPATVTFQAFVYTVAGRSAASNSVTITFVRPARVLVRITNVQAGNGMINVTISRTGSSAAARPQRLRITGVPARGGKRLMASFSSLTSSPSMTLSWRSPYQRNAQYIFAAYPSFTWGEGESSNSFSYVTPSGAPAAPTLVRVNVKDYIVWSVQQPRNTGDAAVTGYQVVGVPAGGGNQVVFGGSNTLGQNWAASGAGMNAFRWDGLKTVKRVPATFAFRAYAFNKYGRSPASEPVQVTFTRPTLPLELAIFDAANGMISYAVSPMQESGSILTDMLLVGVPKGAGQRLSTRVTTFSKVVVWQAGYTPGVEYTFTAYPTYNWGRGDPSNSVVYKASGPPAAPTLEMFHNFDYVFKCNTTNDGGAEITGFTVVGVPQGGGKNVTLGGSSDLGAAVLDYGENCYVWGGLRTLTELPASFTFFGIAHNANGQSPPSKPIVVSFEKPNTQLVKIQQVTYNSQAGTVELFAAMVADSGSVLQSWRVEAVPSEPGEPISISLKPEEMGTPVSWSANFLPGMKYTFTAYPTYQYGDGLASVEYQYTLPSTEGDV